MKIKSLVTIITLRIIAMLILCTSTIGIFAYIIQRSEIENESAKRALSIAQTVGASTDAEQYAEIMQTGQTNEYYDTYSAFLDKTIYITGTMYLYVIDKAYNTNVTYFAEGDHIWVDDGSEMKTFGETDAAEYYPDEMFETLKTGKDSVTGAYDLGEYGMMVSGYSPVLDSSGRVLGVIGVDLSIDEALEPAYRFGERIIIVVIAMSLIIAAICVWDLRKTIGDPIKYLIEVANKLAIGDTNILIIHRSDDEIGQLKKAFANMIDSSNEQARLLGRLADGDYSITVPVRCQADVTNKAINHLLDRTNDALSHVRGATLRVANGSKQITDSSDALAQGSAQQAASVQQLSASIAEIADTTKDNADMASRAAELVNTIKHSAEEGNRRMDEMLSAVEEINQAGQSIGKVIKAIDDIAFQTNILALNAAVEAARAGQHGKGFAVVADEVRNLAAKSAAAAKDTSGLISNSIEKAELGSRIAGETSESLAEIVSGINDSSHIINDIAKSSGEQFSNIAQINHGIDQVAQVVQQNSAAAQESAAASLEMREQSIVLEESVSQFKLKDDDATTGFSIV